MNAVQSWCDHAAAGEITVVEGANPFHAKGFGCRIELAEQIVDDSDQFVAGEIDGDLVDPNDIGEDDGDVGMFLRDGGSAFAIPLDHRLWHQREQQPIVFSALLVEKFLLDREISTHLVECSCEIADFISRRDRNIDFVVAGADPLRALLEPPDRPHGRLRDEHRGHADGENHCCDSHPERLTEPAQPRKRIGVVASGQDCPVQVGVRNVQRRVRL